ncbi:MAG: hypothetical protein QOI24_3360 [Acidobacteriota bacterium]|jgi:hypothetical protein|nr:hypothetical protein [Acidobacteriota bacterium]
MRRIGFAFLVAAALSIFTAPLLRNEVFTLRDHADYFQPLRFHTMDVMRHGHLPLWNPYNASGEPWLANPQSCVFYPPAWLFLVLPFATAYTLFLFFHVILLGIGAYLLFDDDESPHAALIGATALMLSGPVLSLIDISNNLATFAWIPLALWCAKRHRDIAGAFVLALSFLGGEPFFAAVGALLYAAITIRDRRPRALAFSAVFAFALSAVQLLPFVAMLRGSDRRAGLPRAEMLRESMPLFDWLRIAVPPHANHSPFDPNLGQHFIPLIYAGVAVVALALAGAVLRTRRVAPWLALLFVVVMISAGEHLSLVAELLTRLPLTLFRYPARLVPFGALAIAAMATEGFRAIAAREKHARLLALLLATIIAIDLRIAAQPLFATAPFRTDVVPYARTIGRSSKLLRFGDANGAPRDRAAAISGYLNLYDRRFDSGTAAPLSSQRYMQLYDAAAYRGDGRALDRIGGGFVLATRPLPAPRFTPVAHAANITVYRNDHAMPPAMLRGRDGNGYAVDAFSVTSSQTRVVLRAPVDGTVVVTQQAAPGWSVTVDGKAAQSRTIDGIFRGVDVARGSHDVMWSYHAPLLAAGAAITSFALLFFIVRLCIARAFVKRV